MKHSNDISRYLAKIPRVGVTLAKVYEWQPRYFNFALVGATGVVIQYLFTWMLMNVGVPWFLAMAVGIFAAFNSNYWFNKVWVFAQKQEEVS